MSTIITPPPAPLIVPASEFNALKAAGFYQPKPTKVIPRISAATEGRTKSGKTHFAIMTTPEPVAVITMDPGTLPIIDKAIKQGRKLLPVFLEHHKKESQDEAKKLWDMYRKALRAVLGAKSVRTLVIDTTHEAWELIQLAAFGKLKQNNKFAYGGLNAEFSGLIDEVYYGRPDLNTIYIRRQKKLYTKAKPKVNKTTGEEVDTGGDWDGKTMESTGYKDLDYCVDLSLVHKFQEGQFLFDTKDSEATRFGGQYAGLRFEGAECDFASLALHIFADDPQGCDPGYWL